MPRPSPIFIPGQGSMGSQFEQTDIDLSGLSKLIIGLIQQKNEQAKNTEGAKALAGMLGVGQATPGQPSPGQEQPSLTNMIGGGGNANVQPPLAQQPSQGQSGLMSLLSPQAKQQPATTGKPGWSDEAFGSDVAQKGLLQMIAHKYGQSTGLQAHETEIMGSSLPKNLQKGTDPTKSYRVMRDNAGNVISVVGEGIATSRYNPYGEGKSPDYVFNRRKGTYEDPVTHQPLPASWIKEQIGNFAWYKTQGAQRLIRRTESIVAPDGAADEAIRFAKLVNNPAGTPINRLTGKAKIMFGESQRQLLNVVSNISAEEQQQIFGAQGGGEKFLDLAQSLADTNLSVDQYVNAVKEIKYLIYTRQVANVRGTPEEGKWAKMGEKFKADRPFAEPAAGASDMDQFWSK